MRASRLVAIMILLQLRQRLTAQALAAEFEVSERTIYRDIDALSAAGVPVYGDRGPGGGFQLLDGYRTRLTGLAPEEAEAMLMIGMPEPAAALGLGGAADSARRKLLATLSAPSLEGAGRLGERFHLDVVDWYRSSEPVRHLPALARAVLDSRRIAMCYESWTGIRDWSARPLGLVLKGGVWYLVAAARDTVLTFRVAAIQSLTVQAGSFERPLDFDLARYWRESLARFETDLRPDVATVRASASGLRRLSELGAFAARAVAETAQPDGADWSMVTLPIERDVAETARILIGLGDTIEVITPPRLRSALHDLGAQIVARYIG